MTTAQAYRDYLTRTKKNESLVNIKMECFHAFEATVADLAAITDQDIYAFIRPDDTDCRAGHIKNANEFFLHFATFIEKEHPSLANTAAVIRGYFQARFITTAQRHVTDKKAKIIPMPDDTQIDLRHLTGLSHDDFASAFAFLQQLVIQCYDAIAESPLLWGYPDYVTTEGHYNRLVDVLFALVFYGTHCEGVITVDTKAFFASPSIKRHKKLERMMDGLAQMGFAFENIKSETFRVSFPSHPHVITALFAYARQLSPDRQSWWQYSIAVQSFSHRFVENPAAQAYEPAYLAEMDYGNETLREIKRLLHAEAAKYGYTVDKQNWQDPNGARLTKGAKQFLTVQQGRRTPNTNHFEPHATQIGTKVSFIHAFAKAPDKMHALCARFPQVFRLDDPGTCCNDNPASGHSFADKSEKSGRRCAFVMRFTFDGTAYKRCGLGNFFFNDLTPGDVMAILEMYLIENNIKTPRIRS
ncbi:MAG: hypothetical protein FWC71_06305 [Defluviitaleaceae bacterium]|nr:hypothetical protein [Defluviitaleaceae bacterium]